MKTLLIMRHAKSSWDDPTLTDHDRPLNPRGQRDAPRMGTLLRDEALIPDHIVSSTALRARQTAEVVAGVCSVSAGVTLTSDLYHASTNEWCRVIQQLPTDDDNVLCVGHNPGLEDFLAMSTGQHVNMPTAAIAYLSFDDADWADIRGEGDGRVLNIWRPKELPDN